MRNETIQDRVVLPAPSGSSFSCFSFSKQLGKNLTKSDESSVTAQPLLPLLRTDLFCCFPLDINGRREVRDGALITSLQPPVLIQLCSPLKYFLPVSLLPLSLPPQKPRIPSMGNFKENSRVKSETSAVSSVFDIPKSSLSLLDSKAHEPLLVVASTGIL